MSLKEALEGILELSSFSLDLVEKLSEVATPGGETRNTVVGIYEQFKTAFASDHTQDPYYIYHQALSLASHLAMREKDSVKAENLYKEIEDWLLKIATTKSLLGQDSFKALYYFAAHRLTLLALHHSCSSIRSKSVKKLYDLGTMWVEIADKDIVHKVLDSLALVQSQSKDSVGKDTAREYLRQFVEPLSKVSNCCPPFCIWYSIIATQVPSLASSWLDGKPLGKKLEAFSDWVPQEVSSSDLLFIDVQKRRLESERGPRCVLRYTYNHQYDKHYQLMQSVLKTDNTTFLKPCLLLHEQGNNKVVSRKSISIRDLLDSLRGDASRRILMVGDSGVGKTLLSYRMAYDWSKAPEFDDPSQERWGNRFNTAVYVLPARTLIDEVIEESVSISDILTKAIIREYFTYVVSEVTETYLTWRRFIREQLKKPSTLVIVDGISEIPDIVRKISEDDPEYPYKLIVTSRRALERSESIHFDLKLSHMGLADDFRDNYITSQQTEGCFDFINKDTRRKAIMSVPIDRHILFSLWTAFHVQFEQEGHDNYILGPCRLYQYFADYVRDHVLKILQADYQKLESIAFRNMKPQSNDELPEYLREGYVGQESTISDVLLRDTEIESESSVFKHLGRVS